MKDTLTPDSLELRLDDRPHRVAVGSTLADLVARLGHEPRSVGTALNGQFVARVDRAGCVLRAGDAVLLFQPIVGG
jgi:sulfur carrier protein